MMRDDLNTELDKRKLQKLVDDGMITAEELANAPIYVECPHCGKILQSEEPYCLKCGKNYE